MSETARGEGLFHPGSDAAREIERRTGSPQPERETIPKKRGFLNRRSALRWVGWGAILAILGQMTLGMGAFFWPRKVGAFGGEVNAGNVSDMQIGQVRVVQEGKFYVSRVPEGVLSLWWKCPHLGCTVPWKPDDPSMDSISDKGRFNCPCHGSIYDRYGQIVAGPAPRPMDLMPTQVKDGKIYVDTNPTHVVSRSVANHATDPTPV